MTNFSFQPFKPEDFNSLPIDEDIEEILVSDAKSLKQLRPILPTFSWTERMTIGLTAYWLINRNDQLVKLVPHHEFSEAVKQAIQLVENLSPEALAELASDILAEDFEIRDLDNERNSEFTVGNPVSMLIEQTERIGIVEQVCGESLFVRWVLSGDKKIRLWGWVSSDWVSSIHSLVQVNELSTKQSRRIQHDSRNSRSTSTPQRHGAKRGRRSHPSNQKQL